MCVHPLIIISGNSGGGKTSLMRRIMDNEVLSLTSRIIRDGEIEGFDYRFTTKQIFQRLIAENKLAEWASYGDSFYGIEKEELETKLQKGPAFSIVTYEGMEKLKEIYPDALSIFIYTTKEEALKGLQKREETAQQIEKRMNSYDEELSHKGAYDFVIRNKHGKFEETIQILQSIIDMELSKE